MSSANISKYLIAVAAAGMLVLSSAASAQEVKRLRGNATKEQIQEALKPGAPAFRTRGLSVGNANASAAPVQQETADAKEQPEARALDLEIRFELNSDQLTDDGKAVLDQLGAALKSEELAGTKSIVLEGHADATGSAAHNQELSLRRAKSAKNYLATKQQIPAGKLRAAGKGASEPVDPKNPEDAVNRRVRVIVSG